MSSEIDKLVEAVTDLVLSELANHQAPPASKAQVKSPEPAAKAGKGAKILVCPGPGAVESAMWSALHEAKSLSPAAVIWNGYRQDQLPSACSGWKLESRTTKWSQVVSAYKGVVLLGADLSVLGSVANLGAGGQPPASLAVAALSSGLPIFVDNHNYESLRRHSSRLASGFVRRFEELYRMANSFGVEFGGATQLSAFLGRFVNCRGAAATPVASRSGGRDVVTVEDVEAVRRSGEKRLGVAMGTIVTPLAAQRAAEWGIEVVFQ